MPYKLTIMLTKLSFLLTKLIDAAKAEKVSVVCNDEKLRDSINKSKECMDLDIKAYFVHELLTEMLSH